MRKRKQINICGESQKVLRKSNKEWRKEKVCILFKIRYLYLIWDDLYPGYTTYYSFNKDQN